MWVYSVSTPTKITWKCLPKPYLNYTFTLIYAEVITGTGKLENSRHCTIYSTKFVLYPYLSGSSQATIKEPVYNIPKLTMFLLRKFIQIN